MAILVQNLSSSEAPEEWRGRAQENSKAADMLLNNSLLAPAITRYYYAVFQGAVAKLLEKGQRARNLTKDPQNDWPHGLVRDNMGLATGNKADRVVCQELYGLREVADYLRGKIVKDEALSIVADVRQVLKRLGVVA